MANCVLAILIVTGLKSNNYLMSDVASIKLQLEKYQALKNEISKVIVGQDVVIEQILISIFSGGHSLLVGVPGLAKTLMVNTISKACLLYTSDAADE